MSSQTTSPEPRRLYLAVDCGGSKAAAAIAVSSQQPGEPPKFLSRGFGGAANYTDVGLTRFLDSVRRAVEAALDASRIVWRHQIPEQQASHGAHQPFAFPPIFQAAWFGIAGVDSPLNIAVLSPHLSRLLSIPYPSRRLIVANDTSLLASPVIERDDGLPADAIREGVVCIAGTGSIVMSFRSGSAGIDGPSATTQTSNSNSATGGHLLEAVGRVGGFGWLLGDEGGGYMVGKRAVRAVLDQADQERLGWTTSESGAPSSERAATSSTPTGLAPLLRAQGQPVDREHLLRDRILAYWQLCSTDDLLDTVYSNEVILQPSNPDSYGAHRASTSSAASSVLGHGVQSDGGNSGRSSISIDGEERTSDVRVAISDDNTPSASVLLDPSQNLLPPGARQVSEGALASHCKPSSPIPAIPSYPPSPGPSTGDGTKQGGIQATELTRALSAGSRRDRRSSEAAGQVVASDNLPTIAQPAPSLSSAGLPMATSSSSTGVPQQQEQQSALGVRKLRLASLAPLVFHLAFTHNDQTSLRILQGEIRVLADQIQLLLQREGTQAVFDQRRVLPSRCTLCLGGSLLGVEGYRNLLVQDLGSRGWEFKKVVHVEDVARRGCEALAKDYESCGRTQM